MSKAAILAKKRRQEMLATKGAQLNREKWDEMARQMKRFESHLEQFAHAHKSSIQNDPAFRAQFHRMCATLGVDPLTSRKGMWAQLLGVGDYYYELAVRAIEVCVATRPLNGGVISLSELVRHLQRRRSRDVVSEDDVERAVGKLDVLGGGYSVVATGRGKIVTSVPIELSLDHTRILDICGTKGYTTITEIRRDAGWPESRARKAVKFLLESEIAWVDEQTRGEPAFWILGLMNNQ